MGLLCAQLLVVPFDEFWLDALNRFDAVVTVGLFLAALFWALPYIRVSRATLHHLTILRLLRLVARLRDVEQFRLVFNCILMIARRPSGTRRFQRSGLSARPRPLGRSGSRLVPSDDPTPPPRRLVPSDAAVPP